MRTTALVTFGCGTKQRGGTSKRSFGSAYHCTSTENAPYSPVPGAAHSRCATSFWIITVTLSKQPASRNAVMSGVVTLYGRLAHTFHGRSPSVSAQTAQRSARSASANTRETLSYAPSVSPSTSRSRPSSSMAVTRPAVFASSAVRQPTPGPISSAPSAFVMPLSAAMRSGTHAAVRKFCPMDLEKRKPWRCKSAVMSR